ncbi:MAG: hypothetical protein PHC41_08805 [Lachnospiraceae bacterium]|jgi:hypothetical protein|nr:hypothetical protein [Lachnospiraceae bacterium]MDD3616307.1 hypothetical protein [Lachnospiraceae bacterium]
MNSKIGEPKYSYEDKVDFSFPFKNETIELSGVIRVVDPNGTMEQQEEPSYDLEAFYQGAICLFKHVRESEIHGLSPEC